MKRIKIISSVKFWAIHFFLQGKILEAFKKRKVIYFLSDRNFFKQNKK